jgi:hypothetical protein
LENSNVIHKDVLGSNFVQNPCYWVPYLTGFTWGNTRWRSWQGRVCRGSSCTLPYAAVEATKSPQREAGEKRMAEFRTAKNLGL